ncbi:maltose excess protein 1-like, chloroplastic isoform X2 [Cryptomeria japonica]|uniref:maltose excess protein 1-like, chloroplastic isoform X2 n=1 Tax=Cryptomeria japonica TaxID=3369 RepID=UPI0025AC64CB|nr:maltose excess protein 1-like, chloroplastic isoform X2 [Cryptomeria japonica]
MEADAPILHPKEKYESIFFVNEEAQTQMLQVVGDGYDGYFHSGYEEKERELYLQWDLMTARVAEFAILPFLLMQFPQIILNAQNLIAGNESALFAVEWTAQLTSLMGNLSLLSYFVNKRERGASIVQAAGVLTTLIVLLQLAIAGAMPLLVFCATAAACLIGFAVNSLNYTNFISDGAWKVWTDILGVGGMYVLTQVVWLTFVPRLPRSKLPGIIAAALLLVFIELANWGWLPAALLSILEGISGWIATLLFIWSPVSQLYSNIRNPANLHGLSVFTILLALVGNGMLIPRALFIRDMMWFTGSSWGSIVQGWAILLSMYLNKAANSFLFWGVTCGFILWLGAIALKDMHAYSLSNPLDPFIELLQGKRKYEISK